MSSGDQVQGKVPLLLDADLDGREVEGAFAAGNGLVVLVPKARNANVFIVNLMPSDYEVSCHGI